ncbi:MAG TPA: glycosyltransferase [Terriglobia bacterium]|nr:glycosyltransferase [Terriglobia bacterium]
MTGKRIVFCTFGSLGDIHPFLSLAREMKRRGYSPVIATMPVYRQLIESQNIAFHAVRPDIDVADPSILRRVMDLRTGGRYIICEIVLPALRESYEDTAAVAANADLLVTHPITLAAFLLARKTMIPWASVALAPMSLYSIYDPPVLAGVPFAETLVHFGPSFQRLFLNAAVFLFEPQWKLFRKFEKELGLPRSPNPIFWGHSPSLALGLFSPCLAAPQLDWPPNSHASGFPFFNQEQGISPELQRFLDSGKPPVVFTLGSAAVGAAGDFFQHSAHAARSLGVRAVLLVGRQPPNRADLELAPDVIAVPYAPHSLVFPRACIVVHQGGIGTTGEAMRAGRPMLVVPHSHDQPDHAARLTRLGVARSVRRNHYNSKTAAQEIETLLNNKRYADRAADIAASVRGESGAATACDLLSGLLQTRQ